MRVRVLLQSRLSSTRMPAKALLSIGGRPAVLLAAQRAARRGAEVVVTTSAEPEDDAIERVCRAAGVAVFRGSLHDPLQRFHDASMDMAPEDIVVRLTADNTVPDGDLLDGLVRELLARDLHYLRTTSRAPYGLSAEALRVGALRAAHKEARPGFDRDHVTPWIRRTHGDLEWEPPGLCLHRVRCTIDTLRDFTVARGAFDGVADPVGAPWVEMLHRWADAGGLRPEPFADARPNALNQGPWVLGAVQLGLPYGIANSGGLPTLEEATHILDTAAVCGVTHVDTARAYGESEERIGMNLARGLSEWLSVVTKIRPLDDLPSDADPERGRLAVRLSAEQSLRRLQSKGVDVLLLHRWSDWHRAGGAVGRALEELREEGLTRAIGVSLSHPDELVEALRQPAVDYVQLPYNVLDHRWASPQVQEALAARTDVVITTRSVLLQGLLADTGASWPTVDGLDPAAVQSSLRGLTQELGRASTVDLALAYVRGHDWVTSVVMGAETASQVAEQAGLFRRPSLTPDEIAHVRRTLPRVPNGLLDPATWSAS